MITEQEFQRVAAYVKGKAGINLNEKKVLVQGRLDNYMQRRDIAHMTSSWIA